MNGPAKHRESPGRAHARRHPLVTVATALLEADGRIVHWSSGAEALLGYSAAEAVGSYAIGLIGVDERRDEILKLYDRILHGEEWSGTYPVRHRNGAHIALELLTYRIDAGAAPPMVLAMAVDAHAVRQVEADLAVLDSFFSQSPVGMAVYDDKLRFVRVYVTRLALLWCPLKPRLVCRRCFVALTARHRTVRSQQRKFRLRMVESIDIYPRFRVVARLASKGYSIRPFARHLLIKLALMRILVATGARPVFEVERHNLVRSPRHPHLVTISASHRHVRSGQCES